MAEKYRLQASLSRFERDEQGRLRSVAHNAGDIIEPTDAELKAFGDRLEPVTEAPASTPTEAPPAEESTTTTRRR
jgi:hypothetical protein